MKKIFIITRINTGTNTKQFYTGRPNHPDDTVRWNYLQLHAKVFKTPEEAEKVLSEVAIHSYHHKIESYSITEFVNVGVYN